MSKFTEGYLVEGTTLRVVKYISDKMVECTCDYCGVKESDNLVSMIYKESELVKKSKCRFCVARDNAFKEERIINDRRVYQEMERNTKSIGTPNFNPNQRCVVTDPICLGNYKFTNMYPLNVKYGELEAIGYVTNINKRDTCGVHFNIPTQLALKCNFCGYISLVGVSNLNKIVHSCPLCSKLRLTRKTQIDTYNKNNIQKDIERSQKRDFLSVQTEFSKLSRNKMMQQSVKSLEDKNVGYKVVDITKDGGATTYHLVCKDCGSISTCMRRNAKVGICKFCEDKKNSKDFTKVGYLYKNYIGAIFNGLKIVGQRGVNCKVMCIKCKKQREDLDLYGVLSKRYYCDCQQSGVMLECPSCYAPIPIISYKNAYSGKLPKCKSCGVSISEEDVLIAIEGMDYSNSLRAKLDLANVSISDKANRKIRFGNKFAIETLIVEKEPVYKGNDEKSYYRCFCKKHNVGLTLSEDEIMNYQCEYCDDIRQSIIANPDSGSIKLD